LPVSVPRPRHPAPARGVRRPARGADAHRPLGGHRPRSRRHRAGRPGAVVRSGL